MPGGPGLTAADHILWAQRIQKEEINAKSRPDGFSVRAAVSVPGVPTKFKPGHMDPREASGSGFNPAALGWDPSGTMTTEFRRCMNQHSAGPRERHLFPETCQQEIGWMQGHCGKPAQRSAPAGSKPTRLGVGWLMKDGHGGPINQLAAERAKDVSLADCAESQTSRVRKSKDGNVREELGVPPYATSIPCATWDTPPVERSDADTRSSKSLQFRSQSKILAAGQRQMQRAGSMPHLPDSANRHFAEQERVVGQAVDRSRHFLNRPANRWYKPLSNSDVAKFADAYTKAFGVGLYAKGKMLVDVWDQANETFSQLACMEKALDKLYGKLKHEAIKIKRQAKAVAELETPFERNLREATSNKRWGCPNSVLHELAIDSQTYKCRQKIMSRCFENLNGNQDKWRRILKTLILLEYLVKNAGDNIADELRGEQLTFRRLANFQCKDEGQDRGSGVREKAEALVKLLNDKDLLKLEREQAKLHHTKLTGGGPTAIVGGRGSQSTTTNSVSSVLGDALNELRPGNDSRTLSASQAAELERRFNRLKEEQLAERAARERGYKTEGRATSDEAVGRAEAEDGPPDGPREDRFGLFDPRFAPQEGDSDSDGPVRPSNRQAAPDVDLLDLDMEADARPPLSMPASDTILEDNSRASATPDWASFTAAQTPFCEEAPAAERGVDMASLMDLTSSTPTPSAPSASPLIPSFTETGSASAPDPFEGIEFKSAVASQRV